MFWVRGHLQNVRAKSKLAFLTLRQGLFTVQGVLSVKEGIPKAMVKFVGSVPKESVVDVLVKVMVPEKEIKSTTQKNVELEIQKVFTVNRALGQLPFQVFVFGSDDRYIVMV